MNPARLPGRTVPTPAPAAPVTSTPAPAAPVKVAPPAPAASTPVAPESAAPAQGEPFTGLDPLTRSLVEAAPLVPPRPEPSAIPPSPPTQPAAVSVRRGLKQPAVLVALGGSLAAGLLVITGAARRSRPGHPAPTGQRAPVAAPAPILPINLPAPAPTWMVAGGRA